MGVPYRGARMRWALGAQAAAGGHGTADEPRVYRAVAGCRYQPGGADNSGLPTLSNRHQRHWKPDLGVPPTRLAKCDGCSLGDLPGPREPCAPRLSRGVSFTDAARVHQSPQSGSFRSDRAPSSALTSPPPSRVPRDVIHQLRAPVLWICP